MWCMASEMPSTVGSGQAVTMAERLKRLAAAGAALQAWEWT